ncbi:outer membrane beta-barrel family protein [Arcticibacter tournemirensis]|uniref:TonB-dependent receptor n=1 Tax=Arcticibacter tournemirensis TaxID=699437 RepID=A0A4Q0MFL0_9SPHI|nr:outer membrane beta-barrel family protein [Arcticibacter tournemirensis]RXF71686.1 TonB-dependent receptor [Arcticibacter tournemirensis]
MRVLTFILGLLFLIHFGGFAQKPYSVKGSVVDSVSSIKLFNTSISVLYAKDSILCKFTRAANDGSFSITGLPKGKFTLLVTYPGYADYVETFSLDSVKTEINFGNINMFLKSLLLQDVIVKGTVAAIKIKGDTTEYNAGSFKIEPNAKVEDLLKQLPGIQVDQNGKITAQGQTVQKVLVDGEEFFGDDPTLVTKNLRADMVDKVQLYDKKSDQATFTGIDDGEKTKTINVKLKEDKKNGYFGKIDAGLGTDDFYQEQAMFNAFKAKKKISAYGTIANTGKTGLGWQDNSKYGSSSNMEFTDDGGIMIYGGGGDDLDSFDGQYNGQGIPTAKNGGVHYDVKWNNDNQSLNTNYKIGSLGVEGSRTDLSQNNLSEDVIRSTSDQTFDNFMSRQKLDGIYQIKFDTTSTLKISLDGSVRNSETRNAYLSESRRGNDTLMNVSDRKVTNDEDGKAFNASAFWTKKLKKKGRTLSLNVNGSVNQNDAKGFLKSGIEYYGQTGVLDSVRQIDQYKTNKTNNSALRSNLTYSEPITKDFSVIFNYGFSINNSSADRKSFNLSESGYDLLDRSLSNDYSLDQLSNQVGAIFSYRKNNKTTVNFGTRASAVRFQQVDEYTGTRYKRNFANWNPEASYHYKFTQQRSIRISYNGNTSQPGLSQIQPIRVNTDPLNITLGNPDLNPSFTNRFNASYSSYKILSEQSVWINGSYNFTVDPIVSSVAVDPSGVKTYQSINLSGKKPSSFYFSTYLDKKIKKVDMNVGVNVSANGNTYFSLVDNILNKTRSFNYSGGLRISKYKQKKYDFYTNFGPNYNTSESSLQKDLNNNGAGFNGDASFNVYLPGKFRIGSDCNYEYRAKTKSFDENFERFIWNASLSKTFLKQDALKLSVTGYDLLDQNKGFNRSAGGNYISQTSYTNIRRYFMFSLVWDFNKMGGGVAQQAK